MARASQSWRRGLGRGCSHRLGIRLRWIPGFPDFRCRPWWMVDVVGGRGGVVEAALLRTLLMCLACLRWPSLPRISLVSISTVCCHRSATRVSCSLPAPAPVENIHQKQSVRSPSVQYPSWSRLQSQRRRLRHRLPPPSPARQARCPRRSPPSTLPWTRSCRWLSRRRPTRRRRLRRRSRRSRERGRSCHDEQRDSSHEPRPHPPHSQSRR